jgi:hypothetical protein
MDEANMPALGLFRLSSFRNTHTQVKEAYINLLQANLYLLKCEQERVITDFMRLSPKLHIQGNSSLA